VTSRRKFLQTNLLALLSSSVIPGGQAKSHSFGGETKSVLSSAERDYWNDWPSYFTEKVRRIRIEQRAALASLREPGQVQERINAIRSKVWKIIGGPLEKTPLNARTVGTLECKNFRIEKVIFESQPQVYVSANLYLPKAGTPPYPAVLSPLGHSFEGKAALDYQMLFQNLARKGYLVLTFDPFGQGERHQYLDRKTGRPLHGPTGEHDKAGWPVLLLGATFAQYLVWDGIRALDYLLTRPEADGSRLGCVGHSGGATMTMYLCALEPRLQVAVEVEGHTRNFAGPQYVPPGAVADAEQNLVGSMKLGVDRGDMLWAFTPRPLLMIYTVNDALQRPSYEQAVNEIYDDCRAAYRLQGAEERVRLFRGFLPHEFDSINRRETYSWLNRWLAEKDLGTEEVQFEVLPHDALNCTTTGEVLTSLGGRSVVQISTDRAHAHTSEIRFRTERTESAELLARTQARLRQLLSLPSERFPMSVNVLSQSERPSVSIEEFVFRSEEQVRVPGWFMKPSKSNLPLPTVLYVSENGKDSAIVEEDKKGELLTLAQQGFAVCAIGLRGHGETSPSFPQAGPLWYYPGGGKELRQDYAWASLILGNPVLGQQVWDFLRCLDFLATRRDVEIHGLHVAGAGGGALVALLGGVLDDRISSILCMHMLADYLSVVESEDYNVELSWLVPGILKEFDVPELAQVLAPRRVLLLNAVGPRGEVLSKPDLQAKFRVATEAYSRAGAGENLVMDSQPEEPLSRAFSRWLGKS
jgi:cephalosporin-C deacetylase-like acetyl esterase